MKPDKIDCWRCSCCGRAYLDRDMAERCCVCSGCGMEGTHNGLVECVDCQHRKIDERERRRWDKARKVRLRDYDGDGVYVSAMEQYLFDASVQDVYEAWDEYQGMECDDQIEDLRVFGVERHPVQINVDNIIQQLSDDAYEDWEMDGDALRDLERMCAEWNDRHADRAYWPDYSVAIVS